MFDTTTQEAIALYPDDLKYTREHEWARADGNRVRVGITAYAQEALGDIVFVSLPEVGEEVSEGEPCGEVESTKSVSDIYAPVSGTVTARNEVLSSAPELVNSDPYGDGWLVEVTVADPSVLDELLDAAQYRDHVKEQ
ncbi:glycine cleavage system H protein [Parafrankia irregularis]|uniref:Glycine cleavage system H protein n=1 Tax=Parafrankia irregularis TaxID=795642 RepID=A0A0S4QVH0_9ACTN|nr:glycine cleavage system H protein [Parafrankia irregularis]